MSKIFHGEVKGRALCDMRLFVTIKNRFPQQRALIYFKINLINNKLIAYNVEKKRSKKKQQKCYIRNPFRKILENGSWIITELSTRKDSTSEWYLIQKKLCIKWSSSIITVLW